MKLNHNSIFQALVGVGVAALLGWSIWGSLTRNTAIEQDSTSQYGRYEIWEGEVSMASVSVRGDEAVGRARAVPVLLAEKLPASHILFDRDPDASDAYSRVSVFTFQRDFIDSRIIATQLTGRYAALPFHGWATTANRNRQTAALQGFLERQKLTPTGDFAFLLDQQTLLPPWLQQHVVLIPIK